MDDDDDDAAAQAHAHINLAKTQYVGGAPARKNGYRSRGWGTNAPVRAVREQTGRRLLARTQSQETREVPPERGCSVHLRILHEQ